MTRRTLITILIGVAVAILIGFVWLNFFNGSSSAPTSSSGSFGTSTDRTGGTSANQTSPSNIPNQVGQYASGGSASTININGGGSAGGGVGAGGSGIPAAAPGVDWLAGGGTDFGISGGSGSAFNPSQINSVAPGAGGFAPTITSQVGGSGGGNSLVAMLAGTAIAGSLSCALQAGVIAISTSGLVGSIPAGASSLALSATGVPVSDFGTHAALTSIYSLQATQVARNAGKDNVTFLGCIVNTIAKTALSALTASVVNWINSGFNGQPSFVTNYQQFFTNVADLSAGAFIQSSALSFLCSPFQLQIKIAIAQSYANRNSQSCSLSKVTANINNFMNNFSQGGWGSMLQFTTIPTNNPYGAFAFGQVGLISQQQQALANAKNNISPTGFLNLQQLSNCQNSANNGFSPSVNIGLNPQAAAAAGSAALPAGCKAKVVTPGGAIADALGAVNKSGVDQLGLGNDIDQVINALTTQLMTRMLQNGLTSLSQSTTQTPADLAAQSQALSVLTDMQSRTTIAQQLGSVYQGSISDIQNTQSNLNDLYNCWSAAASSTNSAVAGEDALAASTTIASLETQVTNFNNLITQINGAIAELNQYESQISMSTSAADVANVIASYNAAVAAGNFPSQTDLTTAQQNRTTLQSQLVMTDQSTQAGLTQCNASH